MINRGFRLIISIILSTTLISFCVCFNLDNTKSKEKYVKSSIEEYNIDYESITNEEIISIAYNRKEEKIEEKYKIIEKTNEYRKELGLNELKYDEDLTLVATIRALEIGLSGKFEHVRPNGTSFSTAFKDISIYASVRGENIALGYSDPYEVSVAWRNSKGHYENMINRKFKKIGIGYFEYNNTVYWVQIFSN